MVHAEEGRASLPRSAHSGLRMVCVRQRCRKAFTNSAVGCLEMAFLGGLLTCADTFKNDVVDQFASKHPVWCLSLMGGAAV